MEAFMDAKTPRTLLSAILKRNEARQTVRSTRQRSLLKQSPYQNQKSVLPPQPVSSRRLRSSVAPSAVDNPEKSETTPRTLIGNVLKMNKVEKTVRRASSRHAYRKATPKQEKSELASPTLNNKLKQDKVCSEAVSGQHQSASKSQHSFEKSVEADTTEQQLNREMSTADCEYFQSLRLKPNIVRKRVMIRLSDIRLSEIAKEARVDTFTSDLVSKVRALVQKELNSAEGLTTKAVQHRQMRKRFSKRLLSSTKIHNESNINVSITRKDAATNTDAIIDGGEDLGTVIPAIAPSDVDVSSELGPLQLSGITDNAVDDFKDKNTEDYLTNTILTAGLSQSAENQSLEMTELIHHSEDDDSIFSDAVRLPKTNAKGSNNRKQYSMDMPASPTESVIPLKHETPPPLNQNVMNVRKRLPSLKKVSASKRTARKRRLALNGLPVLSSQLRRLVKHYATKRFSKEAHQRIEEASRKYFEQTAKYLQRKRTTGMERISINQKDVEILMKRRRHITRKKPLNVLIEENFPLEYRRELISIATSGNVVLNLGSRR